jgi:hypothetical protein
VALKLEPSLQQKALANMRAGGKYKGSAILPNAHPIDVREELAELAGVGARNISKVKDILKSAHPRLIAALRDGVLTINRAAQLGRLAKNQQVEALTRTLCQRAVSKAIRQSVASLKETHPSFEVISVLKAVQQQEAQQPGSVEVRLSRSPRTVVVVGQDLLTGPFSQQELRLP